MAWAWLAIVMLAVPDISVSSSACVPCACGRELPAEGARCHLSLRRLPRLSCHGTRACVKLVTPCRARMRASVRQICALGPQPRCTWRIPAPSLPAGRAWAHLRAASWRRAPLVALRGGEAPSDSEEESSDDSGDLQSSGDWVYDQSGQHMVKINQRDFDPDERRAEFRNHTLRQLEEQLRQSLAAAREKGWRDATDEDDAMTDAEARGPSADAKGPAAGSVDLSTLPEWLREALEKQTLPVEHAGITSFLEKYREFASGAINTSNVEQGLAYVESKLDDERSPLPLSPH